MRRFWFGGALLAIGAVLLAVATRIPACVIDIDLVVCNGESLIIALVMVGFVLLLAGASFIRRSRA